MKWTKEWTCALESSVFFIQDNLHELTNYMKALLLSLGLNPFDGQSLPIHKCNTNGGPFLEDGNGKLDLWQDSGKVGVASKVGGVVVSYLVKMGRLWVEGNGKLGEDGNVMGERMAKWVWMERLWGGRKMALYLMQCLELLGLLKWQRRF
jgi:hypothetical protein